MTGFAALLGGLGGVTLVFALLILVLALFGAPMDVRWIWGNLVVGAIALAAAAAMNFEGLRERMSSGEGRRIGRYGTSALLSTVLSLVIVALLGFLATRYHARFDWSEQKVHSLSEQTTKLLGGLDQDVNVVAFFPTVDAGPVHDLLDRYAYASDRFKVEYADPNERPDLLERYKLDPSQLGSGVLRIAWGDESVLVQDATEENVTNAIVKLTRTGTKIVYFLEGHNERAIDGDAGKEKEGYERAADSLRNENYRVEKLLLASKGDVPDDADVVISAGATRPLLPQEHAALDRYLERGGSFMALIDPRAKTDLVGDVKRWGVDVGDDIIVDRQLALFGRATTPFASKYDTSHPITKDLRETTLFHVARSVRKAPEPGTGLTEIVFTGDSSWAERDLDRFFSKGEAELGADDLPGPVSIAVVGTPKLEGGKAEDARIAVFGDSDFASNEFLEAYRNRDLFVNTVNWLLGDVEAISIRPVRSRASRFQPSSEQFQVIHSLALLVLPEAIALAGVFTWWLRRQRPGASSG